MVRAMALSKDGRTLLTAGKDLTVTVWDLQGRAAPRPLSSLRLRHRQQEVSALAISGDGRLLLTNSAAPPQQYFTTSELWDISDRSRPRLLGSLESPWSGAFAVALSPDTHRALIGEGVAGVALWDITDRHAPRRLAWVTGKTQPLDHKGVVDLAAFGPDARTALTAAADGSAYLWGLDAKGEAHRITSLARLAGTPSSARISPDGHLLITADAVGTATVWDISVPSDPQSLAVLEYGRTPVTTVAFGTDGTTALTGGPGLPTRLWDITRLTRIAADPVRAVCAVLPSALSRTEWSRFTKDVPYEDGCAG
ncbi:hypothetical protein ABT010_41375 [Streptomyces sp. NPDC002668]|uniref:WD40 repeat domain-containing protein n=1 Tax=Streptomyces sp. NPDC002668 TaxID=3154422 RepID=UPI0033327F06